jgi:putative sterol carrier protein
MILSGCVSVMLADGETFVGVNTGKVDGVNAFTSGKVKVEVISARSARPLKCSRNS